MGNQFQIILLSLPHEGFPALETAATEEGYAFLVRMQDDWVSGENRFAKPGEHLIGVTDAEKLVAVCGLNKDPYAIEATTGRLRHLYVSAPYRRRGLGRALIDRLLSHAANYFHRVRLRTESAEAAVFYEAYGFQPTREPDATHSLRLNI